MFTSAGSHKACLGNLINLQSSALLASGANSLPVLAGRPIFYLRVNKASRCTIWWIIRDATYSRGDAFPFLSERLLKTPETNFTTSLSDCFLSKKIRPKMCRFVSSSLLVWFALLTLCPPLCQGPTGPSPPLLFPFLLDAGIQLGDCSNPQYGVLDPLEDPESI